MMDKIDFSQVKEKIPFIDRTSADPAYLQLINILKQQIAMGLFLPGSRMPSESKLCREHGVSPMTVRRSINALVDQGVVTTVQGSGTFVRSPELSDVTFDLQAFHEVFQDRARTRVKILEATIVPADGPTAEKLAIDPGEKTIYIRRVLIQDNDPIYYHKERLIYDPARPIVENELELTSLHGLFVGSGPANLKRGNLSIEAAVLSKEEAERLNTMEMSPAFRLEHIFFDFDDKPFSWGRFICRGDRLKFTASVGVSGADEVTAGNGGQHDDA